MIWSYWTFVEDCLAPRPVHLLETLETLETKDADTETKYIHFFKHLKPFYQTQNLSPLTPLSPLLVVKIRQEKNLRKKPTFLVNFCFLIHFKISVITWDSITWFPPPTMDIVQNFYLYM